MPSDLAGLWVPVITPLDCGGAVDAVALGRLARRLLDDGCAGLVALGTTGEPATLCPDERRAVVDVCAEACVEASKPLMVGVGSNCTRSTIDDVAALEGTPALAAFLIVVPYYTRPTPAGIIGHFQAIAAASPTPIVAYNVPYRTGRGLDAEALLELAGTPGIVGLKQAVGALDYDTLELLRRKPPGFQVLAGDDAFIAPTILMGGVGAIAASGHVCTNLFARMIDAARTGSSDSVTTLANALLPVVTTGFAEPNPACWKAALHAAGQIPTASLRLPMSQASDAATQRLLETINGAHHLASALSP
ncbi:MAG TPA: 4-hydroxy-tetrahydrodipicolinate synthase [Acidimicrobiales bacterium]|nr:4-hydroxy-tetrahydrodipicolinate synthase [Acidimicrobiales bacterium]